MRPTLIALAVLLVAGLVGAWAFVSHLDAELARPLRLPAEGLTVIIAPGDRIGDVAGRLAAVGALRRPRYLEWHARWTGEAGRIRAGEYLVPPGTGPRDALALFTSGKVVQHRVTLVEGWTFAEMLEALHRHPAIRPTLPPASEDDTAVMRALAAPESKPEGLFLPETYYFVRGTRDLSVLRRAYRAMQDLLAREWAERAPDLPLDSPYEALILASIIEKETGVGSERARIAGVFVRRLRLKMRLETDPTVIYGLGTSFDGNLTRAHLRADTPYNTYVRHGLPPTPIAMPGAPAVHAALHPAPGTVLYFVARGDGSHEFSTTYEQHRAAVQKYQIRRSTRRRGRG